MINVNKLKGKIKECGLNVESVAAEIGVDTSTIYRKMAEETDFTVKEVIKIAEVLHLTSDELTAIFFA